MRRRELLEAAVGALVAVPATAAMAAAGPATRQDRAQRPLVIDGLGDLGDQNADGEGAWTPLMFEDLKASGLTAVNQTVGHVFGPGDPFELTVAAIARTLRKIREHPAELGLALSSADIRASRTRGAVGVVMGFQNTRMFGTDASRARLFADLGVRVVQLTYNDRNAVGDGALVAENLGLTPLGRSVVAELNRNRLLVDLSHSGERTCLEAVEASRAPVTISHTGCRALCDHPRNKTDRELRGVAERGGVVGIYFMPYLRADSAPTADDVARHVEHAIQVCGEDHVAIGTDGSTTRVKDVEQLRKATAEDVARRRAAGISAPGEKPGVLPFVEDLCGPTEFTKLASLLAARGQTTARIEKILGGNLLRLYAQVWEA
jgi:membrane dipeptidase